VSYGVTIRGIVQGDSVQTLPKAIAADYLKAFGKPAFHLKGLSEAPDQSAAHWLGCGKPFCGPGFL
jgi:hypothetical protein